MAKHFQLDVYTNNVSGDEFTPSHFRVFSVDRRISWSFIRWGCIVVRALYLHFRNPYHIVYSFWGYPAGFIAVVVGKILGIPSILHLQGGDAVDIPRFSYGVFHNPVRARICRWAYSNCTSLIALTNFQAEQLRKNRVFVPLSVIPFGVDRTKFFYRDNRFDHPQLRFLHVGNHTPIKGQEVTLKAFATVAKKIPARLVIVGPDLIEGQLKAMCIKLEINDLVEFKGAQQHCALPQYYHDADILIQTSYYEGQGVVFTEAAACGTLIAGTSVGLLADLGENYGIVVEPGDWETLAIKILSAVESPERVNQMRLFALRWAEKYDIHYTEEKIVCLMNGLLQQAAPSYNRNL